MEIIIYVLFQEEMSTTALGSQWVESIKQYRIKVT